MKKLKNPYILFLIPIIAMVFYWVAFEKDNYPTTSRAQTSVSNNQIVMK